MAAIPDPDCIFPNDYGTSCFIKNVITAPNIIVGDYTYYDDPTEPTGFEKNNVLFNYPEFGDRLIIGRYCAIAAGTQFIMGPANHRTGSVTPYPFAVFGGAWTEAAPDHMAQLPRKGDTIIGNDVWIGRECTIMPGARIGDGCIVAAHSVVAGRFEPYSVIVGNPARVVKMRFDDELINLMLRLRWWDKSAEKVTRLIPLLCDRDLERVRQELKIMLADG